MDRRRFLLTGLAGAVAAPLAAGAQAVDRPARLGYLLASLTGSDPRLTLPPSFLLRADQVIE
jgi:hypothetical protein